MTHLLPFDVPVDPDRPEAHDLLQQELLKSEYLQAKPTLWDQFFGGIRDWFNNLSFGQAGGPPAIGQLVVVVVVVALLVIAFLVFGLPRINRRSRVTGALFGEEDARTAAQMRSAAEASAAKSDYATAIAEMFRSIARGLAERTILTTSPGTTAHDFGARAALVFPQQFRELADAALAFDDVRYLGRPGTPAQYDTVDRLERTLRASRASSLEVVDS
jgi:hypothetical protein